MGYVVKIILSWELSVSEIGIIYGIISLITLISAFNDFGMTESINHFLPQFITQKRYDKVKSMLFYALLAQMVTWIIIASSMFFANNFIALHYFKSSQAIDILYIFTFYFLGINIVQIVTTFFMSIQNTFLNKIIELIRMGSIVVLTIWLYIFDVGDIITYSYAWLSGLYIAVLFSLILFGKFYYIPYFLKEKMCWEYTFIQPIIKYALLVFIWAQAGTILSQIDMQMIIYLLGTTDAWYYTNYLSIITIPFLVIWPIFWLLVPIISEMHGKGENEKIITIKKNLQNFFVILGIVFNTFFFIFSTQIAYVLFWEKFIPSGEILTYSILFLVCNFLLQINFNIMAGIGKVKERVNIILIAIICNTILNIVFISYIGVEWAALATGIWWVIIWLLSEKKLGSNFKIPFEYTAILKNILIAGCLYIWLSSFKDSIFTWNSRFLVFVILWIIFLVWIGIFTLCNPSILKKVIKDIRKLKS